MINHQKNPTASAARLLLRRLRPAAARVAHGGATSTGRCAGHVFGGEQRGQSHRNQAIFTGKMWIPPGKIGVLA